MPKAFDRCAERGGRVRTVRTGGRKTQCRKVCYAKGSGKSYAGHAFKCKPKRSAAAQRKRIGKSR